MFALHISHTELAFILIKSSLVQFSHYVNAIILCAIATCFFLLPFGMLIKDIHEPSLANGQIPEISYRWHRQLSDDFKSWAEKRTADGTATKMDVFNVSGTEWPMYSAVFYLWATEALQEASVLDKNSSQRAPLHYSLPAIRAAAALVADPNNATWVKQYWGDDYLHRQNIFYRMLLISGLTSYQKLTADATYQPLLASQVKSLAAELERSPYGLLDDYPHQCYPVDVLPAIAAISRADSVLGTNHQEFVKKSIRGFEGTRLDPDTQLPAYIAHSNTGIGYGPARGVGVANMLIWAPQLWPDIAEQWYTQYDEHFWQRGLFVASVREFSKHSNHANWQIEVDAGPVFAGIGTAASAFGIGAARANGRLDQAYALSAEAMVASWPLPNGTLLTPRLLSNLSDAPHVGEAALLFSFTRMPLVTDNLVENRVLPAAVYMGLLVYLLLGIFFLKESYKRLKIGLHNNLESIPLINFQATLWVLLFSAGAGLLLSGKLLTGVLALLVASIFPRLSRRH